jgi:hypothetical protein
MIMRWLYGIAAVALTTAPVFAQTPQEFSTLLNGLAPATTVGDADKIYLLQGGADRSAAGSLFVRTAGLGTGVSAFLSTPIAGIPATWLQTGAAAANLGFTPVPTTRSITTSGLVNGGGTLAANVDISLDPLAACTIVANATTGSAVPTAVTLGTGLACSGGQVVATGGGGASLTVGDGAASFPNIDTMIFGVGIDVVDDGGGNVTVNNVIVPRVISTTSDTVILSDARKTLQMTNAGATTLAFTAAATLGANFGVSFECQGAGGCTLDPAGAETIDGAATLVVSGGTKGFVTTNGAAFFAEVYSPTDPRNASNLTSGTVPSARGGAGTVTGVMQANGSGVVSGLTKSGTGTAVVTTTGTQTAGRCVEINASGDHIAAAAACGSGGGGGSGALTWISTLTADGSSQNIDFLNLTGKNYKFTCQLTFAAYSHFLIRISTDNGATWAATDYRWNAYRLSTGGSQTPYIGDPDTAFRFRAEDVQPDGINNLVTFNVYALSEAKTHFIEGTVGLDLLTAETTGFFGGSYRGGTTPINAIQIRSNTGNLAAGSNCSSYSVQTS